MEITGKVHLTLPVQSGQGRNGVWKKQEFVITIEGTYPKNICFSLWGDKIDQASLKPGDNVKVHLILSPANTTAVGTPKPAHGKLKKIRPPVLIPCPITLFWLLLPMRMPQPMTSPSDFFSFSLYIRAFPKTPFFFSRPAQARHDKHSGDFATKPFYTMLPGILFLFLRK